MPGERLVYSTDGSHKLICKTCGKLPCKCPKIPEVRPKETCLRIRLEKGGRGGKSVTVVFDLPGNPAYFQEMTRKLKNLCGCGGTYKNNQMEIQGDHRQKVKDFLEQSGFKVKLAGGGNL